MRSPRLQNAARIEKPLPSKSRNVSLSSFVSPKYHRILAYESQPDSLSLNRAMTGYTQSRGKVSNAIIICIHAEAVGEQRNQVHLGNTLDDSAPWISGPKFDSEDRVDAMKSKMPVRIPPRGTPCKGACSEGGLPRAGRPPEPAHPAPRTLPRPIQAPALTNPTSTVSVESGTAARRLTSLNDSSAN